MKTLCAAALLLFASHATAQSDEAASTPAPNAGLPTGVRCSQILPKPPIALLKSTSFRGATVVIEVEILPPGKIGEVAIKESSGSVEWEKSVVAAAREVTCTLGAPVTHRIVARQTLSFSVK